MQELITNDDDLAAKIVTFFGIGVTGLEVSSRAL